MTKTYFTNIQRGRGGLVVNTSDSGSSDRAFEPNSGCRVVSLSKTYLPPPPPQKKKKKTNKQKTKKVLVIPRKRRLRPNVTEILFTGTLSIKPNKKKQHSNSVCYYYLIWMFFSHWFSCLGETGNNSMLLLALHCQFIQGH